MLLKKFFDASAAEVRKKRLAHEIANSPVSDLNKILRPGFDGKFFPSNVKLDENGEIVPPLRCRWSKFDLLDYTRGHVSLLTVCLSAHSQEHVRSYENVFLHRMGILPLINSESKNLENLRTKNQRIVENFEHSQAGKHDSTKSLDLNNFFSNTNINSRQELLDNLRLVSIHPVMNVAKWLLFQLILDPKSSPAHLSHATIYPCAPKKFINQLDLPNRYGAYAFLLDQSSKIRWRASGKGTSEEISSLDSHISALLESSAHRTQPVDPTFNN